VAAAQAQWARYDRQLMPDINVSNLIRAMQQRWREQSLVLGPKVVQFIRRDRTVAASWQGISVPAPPADPNALASTQPIVLPLGNVTVVGSFRNILRHVDRWNTFDRLVVVDGLSLAGNSPRVTGQYTLSCYIFPRGEPGALVPAVSGGAGGGGGFSGGGGGYPGGGGGYPGGGGGYPGAGGGYPGGR
jgi:hypothetical protein